MGQRLVTGGARAGLAGWRQVRNLEGMTVAADVFRFEDSYARAVPGLSVPWTAAEAPAPELLVLNEELAADLGVDPAVLREPPGVALLAGRPRRGSRRSPRPTPAISSACIPRALGTAARCCSVR